MSTVFRPYHRERNELLLEELSNYDIVIFNKLIRVDDFLIRLRKHSTIASYFNKFHEKRLYISNNHDVFDYVDYFVFRSFKFQYQVSLLSENKAKLCNINQVVFNGVMQGFQAILFDIIDCRPSALYVTGSDLQTKSKIYASSYQSASNSMLYDLARHDLIGNFRYPSSSI